MSCNCKSVHDLQTLCKNLLDILRELILTNMHCLLLSLIHACLKPEERSCDASENNNCGVKVIENMASIWHLDA